MSVGLNKYPIEEFYDELITPTGNARASARKLVNHLKAMSLEELQNRRNAAENTIKTMGISFTVYSDGENIDREWPYDIIPRVIAEKEWALTSSGLMQRLKALNMFINDLYNDQKVLKDGIVPAELILKSKNFREQCIGMKPAHGVWAHICGSDLIRDDKGMFRVLEDNLRVPSGVSYMLENRKVTKLVLPELFEHQDIRSMGDYPNRLFETLASISPRKLKRPQVVVLTPGVYNSAYFEHSFLAQQMGCELVQGSDLVVESDDCVYMRTIEGLSRVDVIYRRIDDLFLDPEVFREDSALGVPGLMRAWKKGNVGLANAPGAGVADDKAVYAYVPDIIRYYLSEEPLLENIPTYLCSREDECKYVLENLASLVVKPVNESGGYGLLIGTQASKKELKEFTQRIKKDPRNYIAQPVIALSTAPTFIGDVIEPRHLDLRPFILHGKDLYVTPGGLTRVALTKGSYIVNSSQGGGSKDTWIIGKD